MPPRFIIADTFSKSLAKLDGRSQALVKQAAFDFHVDPSSPGSRFHRLDRATDRRFWSFRVNDDIRIIVHRTEDEFVLCYADHHDKAYAWAETRRLDTHPTTGAAQLVQVIERTEEVVKVRHREVEPPVYSALTDAMLVGMGVPPAAISCVRTATLANLEMVLGTLPCEAAERLLDIACGGTPRPAELRPTSDPFLHPDAMRRFRVVDADELQNALRAPWNEWTVFLHPTQRVFVEREFGGPARVAGGAGTGKTVVALHRAARLARRCNSKVLLSSFSRTLAARLSLHLNNLIPAGDPVRERIIVDNLHRIARDIWKERIGRPFRPATAADLRDILQSVLQTIQIDFPAAFVRAEWDSVVDPWGIRSWQAYRNAKRTGRTTPLNRAQRAELWRVFVEVWDELDRRGLTTWNRLCHAVAEIARNAPPYGHVVVDEAQDLGPAELFLIRALVAHGPDDVFLCGDAGQRIFRAAFPWSACGIDVRGRSGRLSVNYRTTDQIRRRADRLMPSALDEGDGSREDRRSLSLLSGPEPDIVQVSSFEAEISVVARWIRERSAEGIPPEQIGVFARTEALVRERGEPAVEAAGLAVQYLGDEASASPGSAMVGTMHRTKGLEFRAVAIVGVEDAHVPSRRALEDAHEDDDHAASLDRERNLLYVAMTRARERLLLTHTGNVSRFIAAAVPGEIDGLRA